MHYFLDRSFFSKHKAKQAGDDGAAIIEAMDREAASLFGGEPFLYVTNNDRSALSLEEVLGPCMFTKVATVFMNAATAEQSCKALNLRLSGTPPRGAAYPTGV